MSAQYCRFVIDGRRVFPQYNVFGECVWNNPIKNYCQTGKPCTSILDCGDGYCSNNGTCSGAKTTIDNGQYISPSFIR